MLAAVNEMRFASKEWNVNSGLYYYLYRFYDPNLQRWINRDPIGEFGGINLYGLVNNAPINLYDLDDLLSPSNPKCQAIAKKNCKPSKGNRGSNTRALQGSIGVA